MFKTLLWLVTSALGIWVAHPARAQERIDGVIQQRGAFGRVIVPDEFGLFHESEFKGAKRVGISVFNVAFPNHNEFTATTKGVSITGRWASRAESTFSSDMTGVDAATQQRIADKAYAGFVDSLKAAGFDVVDTAELTRLAPEYATWDALPNFSPGRYGAYVAPTGRKLFFLPGDTARRDTSGVMGGFTAFRALDRTQALLRSPYIAHDAHIGIIAVTLVLDYGVYSTSGYSGKLYGSSQVGFKAGATAGAGNHMDSGTLLAYWGTDSGGFPAWAYLQRPVISALPFATRDEDKDAADPAASLVVRLTADAAKFEAAADEVLAIALPRLVGVMAGNR
jgi:hypothetical protein